MDENSEINRGIRKQQLSRLSNKSSPLIEDIKINKIWNDTYLYSLKDPPPESIKYKFNLKMKDPIKTHVRVINADPLLLYTRARQHSGYGLLVGNRIGDSLFSQLTHKTDENDLLLRSNFSLSLFESHFPLNNSILYSEVKVFKNKEYDMIDDRLVKVISAEMPVNPSIKVIKGKQKIVNEDRYHDSKDLELLKISFNNMFIFAENQNYESFFLGSCGLDRGNPWCEVVDILEKELALTSLPVVWICSENEEYYQHLKVLDNREIY